MFVLRHYINTIYFFLIIIKVADSGIEEQDEGDDDDRMKVSIVISVEDEMGRHIDVNIEDEAGQIDVEKPGEIYKLFKGQHQNPAACWQVVLSISGWFLLF